LGDRKAELQGKLKDLASELVSSPEKIQEFAQSWRSGFHSYSFHNTLLILFSNRKASLCAGYRQWKKVGRFVRAGEKAIWILAPGFKRVIENDPETGFDVETEKRELCYFLTVPVFDVSQTDGDPLDLGMNKVKGNPALSLDDCVKLFPEFQFKVVQGVSDGWTNGEFIAVSERKNKAQMVCCYFHELGHIMLGHFGEQFKGVAVDVKEVEAEAVAFLVSSCMGLENVESALYIQNWHGDKTKLEGQALKIISTAEKILKRLVPDQFGKVEAFKSNPDGVSA
jgi:antirestriction protein ArdC